MLLATVLVVAPVAVFALGETLLVPAAVASAPLGDLSGFGAILADVARLADAGDLAGAKARFADLDTAWDDQKATLRPVDPDAWGNVDAGIDAALRANLRAKRAAAPGQATVTESLGALRGILSDPASGDTAAGPVRQVAGVDVTDANGHPRPCEEMHARLVAAVTTDAVRSATADLMARGLERCNADDDVRADAFFAQGLALTGHSKGSS